MHYKAVSRPSSSTSLAFVAREVLVALCRGLLALV